MNFETALNNCIDRLHMGQSIDDILSEFPEYADDITELLDFGLLIPEARAEPSEVAQVMHRLTTDIDALIDTEFGDTRASIVPRRVVRFPYQRIAAGLVVIFAGLLVLTLLREPDENVLNPPIEILISDTPTATITPTMTETQEPSPTSTYTVTPSPTMTETATVTSMPSATLIPPTVTPDGCTLPPDWTTYRVQAGDTISGIAVRSGADLDEIYSANCLERGDFIIDGQEFFVPREPVPATSIPTLIPPTTQVIAPVSSGSNLQDSQQSNDGETVSQPSNNDGGGEDDDEDDCEEDDDCDGDDEEDDDDKEEDEDDDEEED